MNSLNAFEKMNNLGAQGISFLFIIDFEMQRPVVIPLQQAAEQGIYYAMRGNSNGSPVVRPMPNKLDFAKKPVTYDVYQKAFDHAMQGLRFGDSYLLNLTFATQVTTNCNLAQIYHYSKAPYRLLFGNHFTVFSPECFIQIENNCIRSYPMKGTIDASLPGAAELLLQDAKEKAEHNTIVDLIRNDLSMVAVDVRVERFRYIDEIRTNQKHLLQVSSEISGTLSTGWQAQIGSLLHTLLPAGSVSGAPKQKTLQIIREAEPELRGYYTGVFGIFDGHSIDSAVMIRYIEHRNGAFLFRSGGGITINSQPEAEYREMIDKVYLPIV